MNARRASGGNPRNRRSRRLNLKRPAPHLEPKARVLIVCEGGKTEPLYFRGLCRARKLQTTEIKVVGGTEAGGSNPRNIVQYAASQFKESRRVRNAFRTVWCVFDRDEHERINEAFTQARDNQLSIAFSNPSFELWYLLHFEHQGAYIERDQVVEKLERHVPDYSKSKEDMYAQLLSAQGEAIKRAGQLRKNQHHVDDDRCETESPNPSTWVDKLVECLNAIK